MKHLVVTGCSINTVDTICYHLKAYYEWLALVGMTYIDVVGNKSLNNKGAYENLSDFKFWLKYPDYNKKIVPLGGYRQARKTSTVNQIISAVSMFYEFLSAIGEIDKPALYLEMKNNKSSSNFLNELFMKKEKRIKNLLIEKAPEEKIEFITHEQYEKCWMKCTCRRNKIIIGLAYEGGLRKSEILGLWIEDMREIHKGKIYITKHYDPENPTFLKYNSEGITFVSDRLRDEIISYMNEDLFGIDTNYLLINFKKGNAQHKHMTATNINDIVTALGNRAGIKNLHLHMFRHGIAVHMLQQGIPMVAIKDKLRHKHLETTSAVYAKYTIDDKANINEKYCNSINEQFTKEGIAIDELIEFFTKEDPDYE